MSIQSRTSTLRELRQLRNDKVLLYDCWLFSYTVQNYIISFDYIEKAMLRMNLYATLQFQIIMNVQRYNS